MTKNQGSAHALVRPRQNQVEESSKLNKLISDYKKENERCSKKIAELKDKLQNTKFYVDKQMMARSKQNSYRGSLTK